MLSPSVGNIIRPFAAIVAASILVQPLAAKAPFDDKAYSIIHRWTLTGTGGWDYLTLDEARHRLFIARDNRVEVVDTATGAVVGRILNTEGVHGVALAPELKRGFTSNGRVNSVTEFDYDTLAPLRTVAVSGSNPDAILFDGERGHLFTFNGRSKDVTVLDATSLKVLATLAMPDKPEFAIQDAHGHIFVNIESDAGQMVVIDADKLAVASTWALPGCASPSGLALDAVNHRLFSVCDENVMAITDSISGKPVARVRIGAGPDGAGYWSARGLVFSSNGEGTLTIVRAGSGDAYSVLSTLATQRGARTMAVDSHTGLVYLATSDFGPEQAATPEHPHPRPVPTPDTFTVLVAAPVKR